MIPAIVSRIVHSQAFQEFAATIAVTVMVFVAFMALIDAIVEMTP